MPRRLSRQLFYYIKLTSSLNSASVKLLSGWVASNLNCWPSAAITKKWSQLSQVNQSRKDFNERMPDSGVCTQPFCFSCHPKDGCPSMQKATSPIQVLPPEQCCSSEMSNASVCRSGTCLLGFYWCFRGEPVWAPQPVCHPVKPKSCIHF